jgi:hypothetical protein
MQIIPFKSENWESIRDQSLEKQSILQKIGANRVFFGYYRDNFWRKKSFK